LGKHYGILYGELYPLKDEDKIDSSLSISAQERDSWDSGGGRSPSGTCSIPPKKITFLETLLAELTQKT